MAHNLLVGAQRPINKRVNKIITIIKKEINTRAGQIIHRLLSAASGLSGWTGGLLHSHQIVD